METHPLSEPLNAAPPAIPLTVWEAKERAGLLALETEEWREKRRIAEDPNTTADVLERFAREIDTAWSSFSSLARMPNKVKNHAFALTAEVIAAHPNTPPDALLSLLRSGKQLNGRSGLQRQTPSPFCVASLRGLCRNPVAVLICLEKPDFWLVLDKKTCHTLLSREIIPPQSQALIARHLNDDVAQAVKYHVSVSGEIQSRDEGQKALTRFWRTYCSPEENEKRGGARADRYIADLVRWGFLPSWALTGTSLSNTFVIIPPPLTRVSFLRPLRRLLHKAVTWTHLTYNPRLLNFVAAMQGSHPSKPFDFTSGALPDWMERLNAALVLPLSDSPFRNDLWGRSPLDLLHHLARDGNRFVRWAAQTRLADPDFAFTWHEGDE